MVLTSIKLINGKYLLYLNSYFLLFLILRPPQHKNKTMKITLCLVFTLPVRSNLDIRRIIHFYFVLIDAVLNKHKACNKSNLLNTKHWVVIN